MTSGKRTLPADPEKKWVKSWRMPSDEIAVYGREGAAPRKPGTIGYHSLRAGNIPSSHTVFFGGMGERLEITHHSYNWECFARGACDCAAFLADKAPGFYTIKDVLSL